MARQMEVSEYKLLYHSMVFISIHFIWQLDILTWVFPQGDTKASAKGADGSSRNESVQPSTSSQVPCYTFSCVPLQELYLGLFVTDIYCNYYPLYVYSLLIRVHFHKPLIMETLRYPLSMSLCTTLSSHFPCYLASLPYQLSNTHN